MSVTGILLYTGIGILAVYCIWIIRFGLAITRTALERADDESVIGIGISVVIPFRNENSNLPNIFSDLRNQSLPAAQYEVIFIDDHSSDGSFERISDLASSEDNFRVIRLSQGEQGKKLALEMGIDEANFPRILQTDADCRIPMQLLELHLKKSENETYDLIAGPVLATRGGGLISKMEALEFTSLTGVTMAGFATRNPLMCSGANLSYSKDLFLICRDDLKKARSASGDDVFLLLAAKKRKKKVSFLFSKDAAVTTGITDNVKDFLQQRIRWGSKIKFTKSPGIILLALTVWLSNLFLAGLILSSIFIEGLFIIFLFVLVIKSISELVLLVPVTSFFRQSAMLRVFPLLALFYYFYVTIAGVGAIVGQFRWKGRKN